MKSYTIKVNLTRENNLIYSGADHNPIWSHDGTKIVFERIYTDGNREIYVMNADGSNTVNLTQSSATDERPVWLPDGSKIAFVSYRDGNSEIYVMNTDGSNPVNLTQNPGRDFQPSLVSLGRSVQSQVKLMEQGFVVRDQIIPSPGMRLEPITPNRC